MSLKRILSSILPLAVLALSIEIVWRRLVVGQIPTQFSSLLVYVLLAVNVLYLGFEFSMVFRRDKSVR
jgi:hypothetical protein